MPCPCGRADKIGSLTNNGGMFIAPTGTASVAANNLLQLGGPGFVQISGFTWANLKSNNGAGATAVNLGNLTQGSVAAAIDEMISNAPSGGTFHFTSSDGAFSFNQSTDALGVSTSALGCSTAMLSYTHGSVHDTLRFPTRSWPDVKPLAARRLRCAAARYVGGPVRRRGDGMKRVMFTGGSGKAGKHAVQYLVEHGCQVLNLDTKPLDHPKVRTLITDITDSGQVFNALSSYMGLREFDPSLRPQPVDAVVHFAAIPRIMITPDNEVFRINTMGTYNVIEAAVKLGIKQGHHRLVRDHLRHRVQLRAARPGVPAARRGIPGRSA